MTVTANFDFISREMEFQDEEMVRFIRHEQGKKKSDNTVYNYAAGLEELSKWLESEGRDHLEVDFVDLGNYTSYLINERGLADSTCEVKLAGVNEYYKYLLKLSKVKENPTDKFDAGEYIDWNSTKKGGEGDQERVYLEKNELNALVDHSPAPKLRNRLIILFTYYTALRVDEVVNVKLDDLDTEKRNVSVTVKGGKDHTAVWHNDLDGLLTQWLDYGYRDSYPTAADSAYLFPTHRSEQISGRRVNGIIDEAAENAGIQEVLFTDAAGREFKKVTPHTLRHRSCGGDCW